MFVDNLCLAPLETKYKSSDLEINEIRKDTTI